MYPSSYNSTTKNYFIKKMGKRLKDIFLQRICTNGQLAHKKMFSVTNH